MRRLWLAVIAAIAIGCETAPPDDAPKERVYLPPGSSFSAATDSLVAHGIVKDRRWFSMLARAKKYDRTIKAGYYEFRRGERAKVVLETLAKGDELTTRFTVPEGFTIIDIAEAAKEQLGIPAESILVATRDPALLEKLGIAGEDVEGFLLPETYLVSRLIPARALVDQMVSQFLTAWRPEWDAKARALGFSRKDLVTMASIVEAEAKVDEDRSMIAAVYLNRLRVKMPLQADPTVQYAMQKATGKRKQRLYNTDYDFESPYNTYLHRGLPPSPVGSPGTKSIEAVLDPAEVPYLFFVAGPDGKHRFSRTYQEHLRAARQARADSRAKAKTTTSQ